MVLLRIALLLQLKLFKRGAEIRGERKKEQEEEKESEEEEGGEAINL